ncbi:hypothetical protein EDB80DRAFT_701010 [Ilyonectria destructans]|nr:hypothetical protein EDB80DRAFT_701010 [Ilyonectria destructans]
MDSNDIWMEPVCAFCHSAAEVECSCESDEFNTALEQAEARIMQSRYNDVRSWIRAHTQDYIFKYFRLLVEQRKEAHMAHLHRVAEDHPPPHLSEIAAAQARLKQGMSEDWQASVQRYPEVSKYFYSLVRLDLPYDDQSAVRNPPLGALNGSRIARRNNEATVGSVHSMADGKDGTGRELARRVHPQDGLEHPQFPPTEERNQDHGAWGNSNGGNGADNVADEVGDGGNGADDWGDFTASKSKKNDKSPLFFGESDALRKEPEAEQGKEDPWGRGFSKKDVIPEPLTAPEKTEDEEIWDTRRISRKKKKGKKNPSGRDSFKKEAIPETLPAPEKTEDEDVWDEW